MTLLLASLNRAGRHSLVETQASIYHDGVFEQCSMASLSPKLHDWREETLAEILGHMKARARHRDQGETQIKVVVQSPEETELAIARFEDIHFMWAGERREPTYILLPEYSKGRKLVTSVTKVLSDRYREQNVHGMAAKMPVIRVVPQMHKLFLFVS